MYYDDLGYDMNEEEEATHICLLMLKCLILLIHHDF
jgi:hypothetical protein